MGHECTQCMREEEEEEEKKNTERGGRRAGTITHLAIGAVFFFLSGSCRLVLPISQDEEGKREGEGRRERGRGREGVGGGGGWSSQGSSIDRPQDRGKHWDDLCPPLQLTYSSSAT